MSHEKMNPLFELRNSDYSTYPQQKVNPSPIFREYIFNKQQFQHTHPTRIETPTLKNMKVE